MKPETAPRKSYILNSGNYYQLLFFILLSASCVTQRDLEYLQDESKTTREFDEARIADYRLKPNDELYIQINSLDDPTADIFSIASSQQFMSIATIQPYGASLIAYTIDKDGYVLLPVIGRIAVQDKTTAEVSEIITVALKNILSQPMVSVKLVNRYVSVLGEVLRPGHYPYSQDKLSIYDAIGLAGDITDYGNRDEVILTRNENGKNIRIYIDLTRSEVLSSEYYYIRPNDILYVKPMPAKFWNLRQFPYAVVISTLTAGILLYSVIIQ